MVKDLLEEVGFQILEAEEAYTGIRLAQQELPDLILMDIYMPGMNGYEATKTLKSCMETQDIPVIAFTALAKEEEKKKAEESGCVGVINKPIDVDLFAKMVISYLPVEHNIMK